MNLELKNKIPHQYMLCYKYKPENINEIIGNKFNISAIIKWCQEWTPIQKYKALLVAGKNGIGKTLSINLIITHLKYNPIFLHSDESRSREIINTKLKPALKIKKSISNQQNIVIIDDLDCHDYGFISSIIECIKDTQIPIILICNNLNDQSIKTLKTYCTQLCFTLPTFSDVYMYIDNIINKQNENIDIDPNTLSNMIKIYNFDIRQILNQVDFYRSKLLNTTTENKQNTELSIFEITNLFLSNNNSNSNSNKITIDEKYDAYLLEPDMTPLMIQENYITEDFSKSDNISDMELFDSQTHKEMQWELSPYIGHCAIQATFKTPIREASPSKSKDQNQSKTPSKTPPKIHPQISFTKFLGNLSHTNKIRNNIKIIAEKIRETNNSTRLDNLSYLNIILFNDLVNNNSIIDKQNIKKFIIKAKELNLDNDEIKNLLNIINIDDYSKLNYENIPAKVKSSITREWNNKIDIAEIENPKKTKVKIIKKENKEESEIPTKIENNVPKESKPLKEHKTPKELKPLKPPKPPKEPKEPKEPKKEVKKIYLEVPFSKKDEIKLLSGKWDPVLKKWYIFDNNINQEEIYKKFKIIDI
jgi:hypothetical protein